MIILKFSYEKTEKKCENLVKAKTNGYDAHTMYRFLK